LKYTIFRTNSFKKGFKKLSKEHQEEAFIVIEKLVNGEILEQKYKDHKLIGNYKNSRECHIKPDLLLIYKIDKNILQLVLIEIGSHAELF
jgi:mRNA interferase YafQ